MDRNMPGILAYPQPGEWFIVDAGASNTVVGGVLYQKQDDVERGLSYFSKALAKPERNYYVTRNSRNELLAVAKTVEHFHKYLYGQRFKLRTDHASFKCLFKFKNPVKKLDGYKNLTLKLNKKNVGMETQTLCQDDVVQRVLNTANGSKWLSLESLVEERRR